MHVLLLRLTIGLPQLAGTDSGSGQVESGEAP